MKHLKTIQNYLIQNNLDAWAIYQFLDMNPIFDTILGGEKKVVTRRTFLVIPAKDKPVLVHSSIDSGLSDIGIKGIIYTSYDEFKIKTNKLFSTYQRVAMEYSPFSAIPHVSKVDAGIIDLVRSFGIEVVSSGNLLQQVDVLTDIQIDSHLQAAKKLDDIRKSTFTYINSQLKKGVNLNEYSIQQFILKEMKSSGVETVHKPQTVINENAARGHYLPSKNNAKELKKGDLLLIDIWLKLPGKKNIYSDITWMLYRGDTVPQKYANIFGVIKNARDSAIKYLQSKVESNDPVKGWEVDKVARDIIHKAKYGKYFTNRLGHSIGTFVHGNQTHLDNYENRDERLVGPNHVTSIEPSLKFPGEFGMRSEVNVVIRNNKVIVSTEMQNEIYCIKY